MRVLSESICLLVCWLGVLVGLSGIESGNPYSNCFLRGHLCSFIVHFTKYDTSEELTHVYQGDRFSASPTIKVSMADHDPVRITVLISGSDPY